METRKGYKWEVLTLLWIAFFLNQADRQVFNVVLPLIKSDLHLSDVEVGMIATIFNLVFALLVPLAGYVGDRSSKKWIIVFSILLWSGATTLTGFSSGLVLFILFRSTATGAGEALFGPANYATLADYHKKTRAFAMSIHQTAYYLGIITSGFLAGYVGERWGWRSAFYIFGLVGIVHGIILIFRLKDKRGPVGPEMNKPGFTESMKVLFCIPTALILTIAFGGLIFVLVGYLTWTPVYLYEKFNMSLAQAGFHSMFYTHIAAFFGIIIAGKLSDKLAKDRPGLRLVMQAGGLLFAIPFIILMGHSEVSTSVYIGLAGFGFARAFFDANTYSVLYDVIPEKYHASATGVMQMAGFAVGSLAPLILGYLKSVIGLSTGISFLSVIWLICGILLLIGYRFYFKSDYERAQAMKDEVL
ncbi:MFS transporter [Arcticibacter tournemirensis]